MRWARSYSKYDGAITDQEIDVSGAIAVGLYLKREKYESFRGFNGILKPIGVVDIGGVYFIVDGRHRARASLDDGRLLVPAKVKKSTSQDLENLLIAISHFLLHEIPLVEKST